MMKDYYALLGIPKFIATPDEIRRAYLEQVRFFHPDTGHVPPEIAHEKTLLLNQAYDTLKDPTKKRQYDLKLLDALGFSGKKESAQQGSPPKTERPSSETNTTPRTRKRKRNKRKKAPQRSTRELRSPQPFLWLFCWLVFSMRSAILTQRAMFHLPFLLS